MTAIVFDYGGVLMRTGVPTGRREWEARLHLAPGELERIVHGSASWIRAQRGQITATDHWNFVAAQLGIDSAVLPQLRADFFRDDRLDTDLIALIRALRQSGYRLGLLSNDVIDLEGRLRDDLGIYGCFDGVIISAAIGVMKPDPSAYAAVTRALSVAPEDCVFIDDNPANIQGAKDFGMKTILYVAGMDVNAALAGKGITV
ncbi:MAG TPA: HAD family phosphatase [Aggregatilineales bacterium]|nr:HAD family phosphatase [Aggregatilineales bacterium]